MVGDLGGRRGVTKLARCAAALVPVLLAVAAPHSMAASAAPQRIAGTTTFTASANATTVVRVPRPGTLIIDDATATSPQVEVSSAAGRFAGFVLTALDRPTRKVPTLILLRVGECTTAGCRASAPYQAQEYASPVDGLPTRKVSETTEEVTVPAGDYVVRAVTDGAPVRMTLRLSGLSGSAAVRVARPFRAVLRTDASTESVAAGIEPLRNTEASQVFETNLGFMMDLILVSYEPHVRSEWGYCLYMGDRKPPGGRYVPGCPNAEYASLINAGQPTLRYRGVSYGAQIALLPGRWTRGYYATAVGGASSLTAVSLWMDLV